MSQPNIKQHTLKDTWKEWEVVLEVDHDQLNEERATLINEFWSGSERRLDKADCDVVMAVIKLAAETLIYAFLRAGGVILLQSNVEGASYWTRDDLHGQEGWGGADDGEPFGFCGIRLISADVQVDLDIEFEEE